MPEVCLVEYQGEMKRIDDLPGYYDNRGPTIETYVSFLNYIFLEMIDQAKFIFVIEEDAIKANRGQGFVLNFLGFLQMFLDPLVFKDSISIIVTKTKRDKEKMT